MSALTIDALRAALVEPADIDEIVTVPPVTVPAYRPGITPPDLVALVQRWQKSRRAVREAEDHDALGMAEQVLDVHENALLGWTPRQTETT